MSSGSGSGGRRYFLSNGGIIVDEESRESGETGGGLVAAGSEGTRSPLSIPSEVVAAPRSPCDSSGSGACVTGIKLLFFGGVTAGGGCWKAGGEGRKRASCRDGFFDGSEDGAGNSGGGEIVWWLVFVAATGGRKTSCGGYLKSTFRYRQLR